MNKLRKLIALSVAVFMIAASSVAPVLCSYTYSVTFHAGKYGKFTKVPEGGTLQNSGKTAVISGIEDGSRITVDMYRDLGFVPSGKHYYERGFVESGHDNDETSGRPSISIKVEQDASYTVAYGVKGKLVSYVVKYVDEKGKTLLKSDTYYGMIGDKPVVSYRYKEGYLPNAYNEGKTLVADSSKNVFVFKYHRTGSSEEGQNSGDAGQSGQNNAANGANGNANGANGGGTAAGNANGGNAAGTSGNGQTSGRTSSGSSEEPSEYADLDDGDTPLAGDSESEKTQDRSKLVYGGIAAAVIIAGVGVVLVRRKKH